MKKISTKYYKAESLLITELCGEMSIADIEIWKAGLQRQLTGIEKDSAFKILINLYEFKPLNLQSYKKFRKVLPELLSRHNWKIGHTELFEDFHLSLTCERGVLCYAAAHVHHDVLKMEAYQKLFGRHNEHYFCNLHVAEKWIRNF